MLTLQIKEKEIENLTPEEEFVRGTVGAKCQINFDEFWQSYNKYIVFKRVGYEPINFMVDTLENEIEIPYTILAESGEFKIGVFGTTETETLPTLYSKDIKILYGTDTHGTTPPTYIPSEIDQLRLSKQDKLVSGENIKTVNGESVLGLGNIKIQVEVDQIYDPDSTNAQSGTAVDEALSGYVMAEVGKGLSSNDFTNEDKEKLYSALQNENIDKTYNPESENAQSGKAVSEAISNIDVDTSHINNTFANALKSTKTDKAVAISDMSPIEHDLKVKLSGEIEDFSSVEVSLFGKNLLEYPYIDTTKTVNGITFTDNGDGTITANGTATADAEFILQDTLNAKTKYNPFNYLNNMKVQVTGSPSGFSKDTYYIYCIKTGDIGGAVWNADPTRYRFKIVVKAGQTVKDLVFKPTILLYDVGFDKTFEKYNRQIITASADGVIEGIKSTANITILTNNTGVTVECEYNRDINKAFAALEAAIVANNS